MAQTEKYLAEQHRQFMQLQSQDTVIVPVKYTTRSIGQSTLGPDLEEVEEFGTVHQQMDRHSDDEQYDMDSPAGYRNTLDRD